MSAVAVEGVSKSYGVLPALRDVSFSVDAGEVLALLGPNGAGKTTLISLLLGLARPDAGAIRLFGATPTEAVAAGRVGAMFQHGGLSGRSGIVAIRDQWNSR